MEVRDKDIVIGRGDLLLVSLRGISLAEWKGLRKERGRVFDRKIFVIGMGENLLFGVSVGRESGEMKE